MGSISDSFSNLTELLVAERAKASPDRRLAVGRVLFVQRVLSAVLPRSIRVGQGSVVDLKDRLIGPFDIVASSDGYPAFGEGPTSVHAADGVAFCIQIRNWTKDDLTVFGKEVEQFKKIERKRADPIPCFAVSYETLSLPHVEDFLKSTAGQSVDGLLSVGQHLVVRNTGWYGSPATVPFVTERSGPEALKAFSFLMLRLAQDLLGLPFGIGDYQHL